MKNRRIKLVLLTILGAVFLFQILLLVGIVPYKYTWGGRLEGEEQARVMIIFSMLLNVLFLVTLLLKIGYLKVQVRPRFIKSVLWLMVIIFTFNTIGNLFAKSDLERFIATPITFILSFLCYKIANEK